MSFLCFIIWTVYLILEAGGIELNAGPGSFDSEAMSNDPSNISKVNVSLLEQIFSVFRPIQLDSTNSGTLSFHCKIRCPSLDLVFTTCTEKQFLDQIYDMIFSHTEAVVWPVIWCVPLALESQTSINKKAPLTYQRS